MQSTTCFERSEMKGAGMGWACERGRQGILAEFLFGNFSENVDFEEQMEHRWIIL
jgi:pterin-4a-carbinolamine dehydratase